MLDDLKIRKIRVPVYWSEVEKEPGIYDFSKIDFLMDEAAKRNAQVTLVVGLKVPRWPECFLPQWLENEDQKTIETKLFEEIQIVVERYVNHPALERWQVENEALFPFGDCPQPSAKRWQAEIRSVRLLDGAHPIQLTASGDKSFWLINAFPADILGVSIYERAWNHYFGFSVMTVLPIF